MTRRKHGPELTIGFDADESRTKLDVQRSAQWLFLLHIQQLEPKVLASLARVPADLTQLDADEPALRRWATKWHLPAEWCLAHARATYRFWKEYEPAALGDRPLYWCDRGDLAGTRAVSRRGRRAARPTVPSHHFVWLVAYQIWKYRPIQIGTCAPEQLRVLEVPAGDQSTVRRAITTLAALIDLPLR